MRNHTVVIGYGTKGRSAVNTLRNHDVPVEKIVVIDSRPSAVAEANRSGLAAFEGDATRRDLLRRAEISKAREVVITLNRDDSAILTTLTVRQLSPRCHIVVSGREDENLPLLRESGADAVVTSADAVGRLLGLSSVNPHVGTVVDDLLSSSKGMEDSLQERNRRTAGRYSKRTGASRHSKRRAAKFLRSFNRSIAAR